MLGYHRRVCTLPTPSLSSYWRLSCLGLVKKQETGTTPAAENTILPPASGTEGVPFAVSATTGEEHPVENHPLLRVDVIPPMDGSPADQTSSTAVTPSSNGHHVPDEAAAHRG